MHRSTKNGSPDKFRIFRLLFQPSAGAFQPITLILIPLSLTTDDPRLHMLTDNGQAHVSQRAACLRERPEDTGTVRLLVDGLVILEATQSFLPSDLPRIRKERVKNFREQLYWQRQ